MYINRVTLLGNVGRDPETRTFQNGGVVCSFSLATSESWKDKGTGERKTRTQWHNVQIFNESTANFVAERAKKGSRLLVEGTLETRKYTDKNGEDRYVTEVVVRPYGGQVILLDGNRGGDDDEAPRRSAPAAAANGRGRAQPRNDMDDDIPF